MAQINVAQDNSIYRQVDSEFVCTHTDVITEKACCSTAGDSGYIECGCAGLDSIECTNPDCSGITDEDILDFSNDCWS